MVGVDNRVNNRGFAIGCNFGAFAEGVDAPLIGFLNPDVAIKGPFMDAVAEAFRDPSVVIAGNRFGKPQRELDLWGCRNWVCGAAMFVRRTWFTEVGGFDERFVWSHEETDLIRQAQAAGRTVRELDLPIEHDSPEDNPPEDVAYKVKWMKAGSVMFKEKWR